MNKKVVVVTGCSTGIGRCAVKTLHQRGYYVIAMVRNPDDAEALMQWGIPHVIEIDLAKPESVSGAITNIVRISEQKIFALFNNAAYGQPGAVEDLSRDTLRRQFEVNVFGTHQLTCGLLPFMLKMSDARIIQNSSVLGFAAMPMRGAYNASKFALEGLSDTLRLELKGTRVKVSLIQPGPILSSFRENALAALEREVDLVQSRHAKKYEAALARLRKSGPAVPFTLPPEAVVKKLIHALESPNPKSRYKVTLPTYLMAVLKTLLPSKVMDQVLIKAGK